MFFALLAAIDGATTQVDLSCPHSHCDANALLPPFHHPQPHLPFHTASHHCLAHLHEARRPRLQATFLPVTGAEGVAPECNLTAVALLPKLLKGRAMQGTLNLSSQSLLPRVKQQGGVDQSVVVVS
jgi:hypothetical protein